jgi:phospholipid transport system substrate-binding protein
MNMRGLRLTAVMLMACFVACLAGATAAPADDPQSPKGEVAGVTAKVLDILRDPKLSAAERRTQVKDLAYHYMDFETLSRLTLGRYWRDLTPAQKNQFVEEFKQHLSNTYSHTFDEYHGEEVRITGDRPEADGDVTVLTKIIGDKDGKRQDLAKVDYRLRKHGEWRVIDVTVEGISLVANFRSQFQSIMANGGINRLLSLLHEKNAAGEGAQIK